MRMQEWSVRLLHRDANYRAEAVWMREHNLFARRFLIRIENDNERRGSVQAPDDRAQSAASVRSNASAEFHQSMCVAVRCVLRRAQHARVPGNGAVLPGERTVQQVSDRRARASISYGVAQTISPQIVRLHAHR